MVEFTSDEPRRPLRLQQRLPPQPRLAARAFGDPGLAEEDDVLTSRILGLLAGVGLPRDDVEAVKATPLEYRGQWQPKAAGAETGHGEVPQDWAIERASENDRALAQFGWAGGSQLCLSNAFRQADEMEAKAQDLIDSGKCTEDDAAVQVIRTIAQATEEREAVMRRQWCDIEFQEGEQANKELLRHLERDFATQLCSVASKEMKGAGADAAGGSGRSWSNIKIVGGTRPGRIYLGAGAGGEAVELASHDDGSGRQRWFVEPAGTAGDSGESETEQRARPVRLRLAGGTSRGRRLLSRGAGGLLELCERDDGSGRQWWRLEPREAGGSTCIRTARGDPGLGAAADVEKAVRGTLLGAVCCGDSGPSRLGCGGLGGGAEFRPALVAEDGGSGRERWLISDGGVGGGRRRGSEGGALDEAGDDVVALVEHSGAQGALSLRDLSQEQMTRVIGHSRNLGVALDLVGAYLKNYEIDKADRLCARIWPLAEERGGVWKFKLLNFYSTVRMKQSRYQEALDMYKEYETLIGFSPEEAWELYDTVYRNFGWIYTSLNDYDKALEYFERCVHVKRAKGIKPHWFDQWDLGKTHARLSLSRGKPEKLDLAFALIQEGLEMHKRAEPTDFIMRCKMLSSCGECASILGDFSEDPGAAGEWFDRSIELHREAYALYMKTLGPTKPLTGWTMEDLAGALQKRGLLGEAKEMLHGALAVECSKDIIKLPAMARLLDSVLHVHEKTDDLWGLARCQDSINTGLANLQSRRVDQHEGVGYAVLLQKISRVLLAQSAENHEAAAGLLEEAVGRLHGVAGGPPRPEAAAAAAAPDAEEERERFELPRAGQQQLEGVDAARLLPELELQLRLLRAAAPSAGAGARAPDRGPAARTEGGGTAAPGAGAGAPDGGPTARSGSGGDGEAQAPLQRAGGGAEPRAPASERAPPPPLHFEIVEEFVPVD